MNQQVQCFILLETLKDSLKDVGFAEALLIYVQRWVAGSLRQLRIDRVKTGGVSPWGAMTTWHSLAQRSTMYGWIMLDPGVPYAVICQLSSCSSEWFSQLLQV